MEGCVARRHLVKHRAERKQVGAGVERLTARLLGRHVGHRPKRRPGVRQMVHGRRGLLAIVAQQARRPKLGEAKVEDLHLPRPAQKNIRRLDVAVRDAARMGCVESLGDLQGRIEERMGGEGRRSARALRGAGPAVRPGADPLPQRRPFEQLHHDERLAIVVADFVDSADVRMVQRRRGAGFPQETGERLFVAGGIRRKKFQRHLTPKRGVLGAVNFPHAARTKPFQNSIMRYRLADQSRDPKVEITILCSRAFPCQRENRLQNHRARSFKLVGSHSD